MTQLLIVGTGILAIGPFTITGDAVEGIDIIYPKSIIPGFQIHDVSLPPDFTVSTYLWINGALHAISEPTPQIDQAQALENYKGLIEIRADVLQASGDLLAALLLRESLK